MGGLSTDLGKFFSLFYGIFELFLRPGGNKVTIPGTAGPALLHAEVFIIAALGSGALNQASIAAGIASSATGIPFNIVQGVVGIILSLILLPVLSKIPDVRDWIER